MAFVKKYFSLLFIAFLLLLPLIFFHSKLLYLSTHRIGYIYSQYHVINYLYTVILTGILYYVLELKQWGRNIFIKLSKLSFFVFFVHVLILDYVWGLIAQPLVFTYGKGVVGQLWFDPLLFTIITGVSFGIAYAVHKLPLLSKITG